MSSPDPVAVLAELLGFDVDGLDQAGVERWTKRAKSMQGSLDAFNARLATRSAALQPAGESAADFIQRCGGVSANEARRRQRRAEALDKAKQFADALSEGKIGSEHVDALANITAKLDDDTKAAMFDHEQQLLDRATHMSPEQFARACRQTLGRIERDQGVERRERQRRETRISRRIDSDGMHHLTGVFHPELGAAIWHALDAEIGALVAAGNDRCADRQQLAAVAFGSLVLGGHQQARPAEAEISVIIDLETMLHGLHEASICEYTNGIELPPTTVRRMACQGQIIPIVFNSDGVPIEIGREKRLATRAQRRALRAMYRTCAFPGCDCAFDRCEMHHIIAFEHGGLTNLDNLIPLCSRHHHLLHELGWILELAPDRSLTIRERDGTVRWTAPPPTLRPAPSRCRPNTSPLPTTTRRNLATAG